MKVAKEFLKEVNVMYVVKFPTILTLETTECVEYKPYKISHSSENEEATIFLRPPVLSKGTRRILKDIKRFKKAFEKIVKRGWKSNDNKIVIDYEIKIKKEGGT